MRIPVSRTFACYVFGLFATFAGAWLMDVTGSMWPLALGGATSIMCTRPLVTGLIQTIGWRRR